MVATKSQYELSQALVGRGQEQFANKGDSDEKKEINQFFYWIMQQIENEADKSCWRMHAYQLELRSCNLDDKLRITHRRGWPLDQYDPSKILNKKRFSKEVMKEVAGIINGLPNFTASYVRNDGFGNSLLYVTMEIPLNENPHTIL